MAARAASKEMSLELDVILSDPAWKTLLPRARNSIHKALTLLLPHAGVHRDVSLAVVLTNDRQVKALNMQYRNKNSATNVLSFSPYEDAAIPKMLRTKSPEPLMLGDIILARQTVMREAKEQKKDVADHTIHLVLHGCLHLLGHDHQDNRQATAMEAIEIKTLAALGIDNPYVTPHL